MCHNSLIRVISIAGRILVLKFVIYIFSGDKWKHPFIHTSTYYIISYFWYRLQLNVHIMLRYYYQNSLDTRWIVMLNIFVFWKGTGDNDRQERRRMWNVYFMFHEIWNGVGCCDLCFYSIETLYSISSLIINKYKTLLEATWCTLNGFWC